MPLVSDIITASLRHMRVLGAGEVAEAEDSDYCLSALKSMLDAWNVDPQSVVGLQELTHTPTAGAQSFTIGPSGDLVGDQPFRIERAVYRQGNIDWPVEIISVEEYAELARKTTRSTPVALALNRGTDTATVYVYPAAEGTAQLRMWVLKEAVPNFDTITLTTSLTLPSGLQNAIEWNLPLEVSAGFSVDPATMALIVRQAGNSLRRFKRGNVRIPSLAMPGTAYQYDVESDRWL